MSKRQKWVIYEGYTGKVLVTAWSFEGAEVAARKHGTSCFFPDNHLPEWAARNWRKGDVLPLRDAKGNPA